MPSPLQRPSLVRQTACSLRAEIVRGAWSDWLPSERELAASLLIGRNTLRAALRELAAEGMIEPRHGAGHRILRSACPVSGTPRSVGLLIPEGLHSLRPNQTLWIDHLRALLMRQGFELQFHHLRRFPRDPQRHACWVLVRCPAPLQRRFARSGIACVIAGTAHPGVHLPCVDLDHRATCRHAAGILIARGHRRLAFLTRAPRYAGDLASELGFADGARTSAHPDVVARIVRHDDTRDGLHRALRRLLRSPQPPSALLIADPHHCLTVGALLASSGQTRKIALLCRDDAPFLAHLVPEPARYASAPVIFARQVFRLILKNGSSPAPVLLAPRLIAAETLHKVVP